MESVRVRVEMFSSRKMALEVVGRCWIRFGTIVCHVESALNLGALCQASFYILLVDAESHSHVSRPLGNVPCIDDIQTDLIIFINDCMLWHLMPIHHALLYK